MVLTNSKHSRYRLIVFVEVVLCNRFVADALWKKLHKNEIMGNLSHCRWRWMTCVINIWLSPNRRLTYFGIRFGFCFLSTRFEMYHNVHNVDPSTTCELLLKKQKANYKPQINLNGSQYMPIMFSTICESDLDKAYGVGCNRSEVTVTTKNSIVFIHYFSLILIPTNQTDQKKLKFRLANEWW